MQYNDFVIGDTFRCGDGMWRCTDIGTRTITAIRIDHVEVAGTLDGVPIPTRTLSYQEADADGWFNGPPYAVAETVFDEDDLPACSLTDEVLDYPGQPPDFSTGNVIGCEDALAILAQHRAAAEKYVRDCLVIFEQAADDDLVRRTATEVMRTMPTWRRRAGFEE